MSAVITKEQQEQPQPVAQIPRREELRARPVFLHNKKVVLWEFVERDIGLGLKGWPRTVLPAPPPKSQP